jgi:hypothetical protein
MPANIPSWRSPDSFRLMTPRTGKINPAAPEAEHQTGKARDPRAAFRGEVSKARRRPHFLGMQGCGICVISSDYDGGRARC